MREFYSNFKNPCSLQRYVGICAIFHYIKHVECVLPPLGPRNPTEPPTVPIQIVKSNHNNVDLQMNALSLPQCPRPISPSHLSGDTRHNLSIKCLEQLLASSLASRSHPTFRRSLNRRSYSVRL